MINKVKKIVNEKPDKASAMAGLYLQACIILSAAFSIPIILENLGINGSGIWFSLQGFASILSLSDFGFSIAISRQIAHSFKLNLDVEHLKSDLIKTSTGWLGVSEIYWASRKIFILCSIISIIGCIFLLEIILPYTKLLLTSSEDIRFMFYPLAASIIFILNTKLSQSVLDGLGYMYLSKVISGTYQLILGLFCIISLKIGAGIVGLALAYLLASIIQLMAMSLCLKVVARGRLAYVYNSQLGSFARNLFKVAVPFGIVISGAYLIGVAQIPLLGSILGPAVVTGMVLAFKISQTLSGLVSQLISADIPFFTQNCAIGNWGKAKKQMINSIVVGSTLQIFVTLFLLYGSTPLVDWWLGPNKYIPNSVLIMFCVNYLITSIAGIPAQFVLAEGRNPFAISTLMHGILSLVGMLITCNLFGLIGVPLASLIALLLTNFWVNPYHAYKTWNRLNNKAQFKNKKGEIWI
jgi:O-antigen/teichoic acid export membrane protein